MLKDWLSVLLPLKLPDTAGAVADSLGDLRQKSQKDDLSAGVLAAAPRGARAVQEILRKQLAKPLEQAIKKVTGEAGEAG
jgi:hypothetical protein